MSTQRQKTIAEYMNGLCRDRDFTAMEVALIETQIKPEWRERIENNIKVNGRTNTGKEFINTHIAERVNGLLQNSKIPIKLHHIKIYKKCWTDEYTDRTGKCSWGFKEIREKLGYDPNTGLQI